MDGSRIENKALNRNARLDLVEVRVHIPLVPC